MCQHIHKVRNKYTGKELFVPCGKCEACLQDKADSRAMRIDNHYPDDGQTMMCMLTLTYDNAFVPYIRKSDILLALKLNKMEEKQMSAFIDYPDENPYDNTLTVPIYRDYDIRWNRSSEMRYTKTHKNLRFERDGVRFVANPYVVSYGSYRSIGELTSTDLTDLDIDKLPSMVVGYRDRKKEIPIYDNDKVTVAYYPDLQKFFKRLRINLKRDGYSFPLSFYGCSEYGEQRSRAHFHVLLFFPKGYYEIVKRSCLKSWTYDYRTPKRCDFRSAVHPASYVASYVNCALSIPAFLKASKVKPKHSYSFRFGCGKADLSLSKVKESFDRRDFLVYREFVKDGVLTQTCNVLPSYVISRYAPKCKGYSRLTLNQRYDVASEPQRLSYYAKRLNYYGDDWIRNYTMLINKRQQWLDAGYSRDDFAKFYAECWTLRASKSMILSHQNFDDVKKIFQYYFNIKDYYDNSVSHGVLDDILITNPPKIAYEVNPNYFDDVFNKHLRSYQRYHYYKKVKHVNAIAFQDDL